MTDRSFKMKVNGTVFVKSGYNSISATTDGFAFQKGLSSYATKFIFNPTNIGRDVTFQDKAGTVAFTSDLPVNPITGTGTTSYIPKFTGAGTLGNSQLINTTNLLELRPTLSAGTDYFRIGTYSANGLYGSYLKTSYDYSNNLSANLILGVSNLGTALDAVTILNNGSMSVVGTITSAGLTTQALSSDADATFNAMPDSSYKVTTSNAVTSASTDGFYYLESFRYASIDGMQRATYFTGINKGKMYVRIKDAGTWAAWVEK